MASLGSSEWRDVCGKFQNAQTLSCEESLNDPVGDPYRSKYKARELLREIHCTLKSLEAGEGEQEESGGDAREQRAAEAFVDGQRDELFTHGLCADSPAAMLTARLAAVEYFLGVNHAETEELSAGHEHLMNCVMLLDRCRVTSENVSLAIHVRVRLGSKDLIYPSSHCSKVMSTKGDFQRRSLKRFVVLIRMSWASCGRGGTRPRKLYDSLKQQNLFTNVI